MSNGPIISIIMPSYNHASYIGEAIQSLLAQTFRDFELIIIDDGSNDDSPSIINSFAERDSRIVTVFQKNKGPSAAVNRGLKIAKGAYITSHPSDDRSKLNRLEVLSTYLNEHQESDFVGSYIEEIDDGGSIVTTSHKFETWFNLEREFSDPRAWIWHNRVASPTLMFRRDFFQHFGGFDQDLIYTQDWEILIRSISMGAKLSILPDKLFQYRSHADNLTNKKIHEVFYEYAYISSKRLIPWLLAKKMEEEIFSNIYGFINNVNYVMLTSNERRNLILLLTEGFDASFSDFRRVLKNQNHKAIDKAFSIYYEEQKLRGAGSDELFLSVVTRLIDQCRALETRIEGALGDRDIAIAGQDIAIADRDIAIADRDIAIADRDIAIADRNEVLTNRDAILCSTSWRITKPMRVAVSASRLFFRSGCIFHQSGSSSITLSRIIKGFSYVINGDISGLKSILANVLRETSKSQSRINSVVELIPTYPLAEFQPLVSVVIPCFNYGRFVADAVDSIMAQTLRNVEIIVVDGGSTDTSTRKILRTIQRPRTTILFREGRHLVGDNRNFGIAKANGRYICCLDADDTLDPTYLEKAVFYLETYRYDIVSTAINFVGAKEGQLDIQAFPDLTDMVSGNHVLTCAVFRRRLWESSGGYVDVGVGSDHVAEDWDFWIRLAATGARIRNISGEHLFNYRIHEGGSLSSAADVRPLSEQNAEILDRNREILTPEAFHLSAKLQSRNFRCNPSETALAINYNIAPNLSKRTLLLAIPFSMVGGAERLLSGLCQYLVANDWRVIVITTLDQDPSFGSSIDWFKDISSEIYELPRFLEQGERGDFIDYLIASRKPDCLLNAGSLLVYEMLPSITENYKGICIVDLLFNAVGHVKSHLKFKEFFTYALAENQEVYDWFVEVAGWPANRIRKMSSGVDLKRMLPMARPKNLIDKYGIAEDELVVGFSGRLSEEKAPEIFVEIAKLCQGTPKLRFVMTGAGPMTKEIVNKLELLPSSVKFEFAGLVEDVNEYFALYDVLVLPSRFDGRPLVVMEALACGLPVIASNVGALPDLIADDENGYLLPAANARVFAERIKAIAGDRELLSRLKIGARRFAEDSLDANKAYCGYEFALNEAIEYHRDINGLASVK